MRTHGNTEHWADHGRPRKTLRFPHDRTIHPERSCMRRILAISALFVWALSILVGSAGFGQNVGGTAPVRYRTDRILVAPRRDVPQGEFEKWHRKQPARTLRVHPTLENLRVVEPQAGTTVETLIQ